MGLRSSLTDGRAGGVVPFCFAGCDARAILAELRRRGLLADRPRDDWRPLPPPVRPAPRPAPDPRAIARLWDAARRITAHDPAGLYLMARGCRLPHHEGDLRWLPEHRHPSGHVGPALLALVTAPGDPGRRLTLHRTWIAAAPAGAKGFDHLPRAARPEARLYLRGSLPPARAVRLWPDCEVTGGLGIGEGIESSLALARGIYPVWACLDAGGMAAFPVLAGIEGLTVAVDHDLAGIKAAGEVARRWLAAGREVRRIMADVPGEDAADIAGRIRWAA